MIDPGVCGDCGRAYPPSAARCYRCCPGNPGGANGPRPRGEAHPNAKLASAAAVRGRYAAVGNAAAVAREFGVSRWAVRRAVRGETYKTGG